MYHNISRKEKEQTVKDNRAKRSQFRQVLEVLINFSSMENMSDTPDFLLAEYLSRSLELFDTIVERREHWYGRYSCDNPADNPADNSADNPEWTTDQMFESIRAVMHEAEIKNLRIRIEPLESGHTYNIGSYEKLSGKDHELDQRRSFNK